MDTFQNNRENINSESYYYKIIINGKSIGTFKDTLKNITWENVISENNPIECFNTFSILFSNSYEKIFHY